MIRIYSYPETDCGFQTTGNIEYEYSCPSCCKALRWRVPGQMSPFNCLGCGEKIVDASGLINKIGLRMTYHLYGEKAVFVQCGAFAVV